LCCKVSILAYVNMSVLISRWRSLNCRRTVTSPPCQDRELHKLSCMAVYVHMSTWKDNNKVRIHDVGLEGIVWIDLAQDRNRWRAVVNAVMNFQIS
jgi:hypothetical protein